MSESKSASVVFTNSSLLAKNAQVTADSAKSTADNAYNVANNAQRTADGKNSIYRGSDPNTVPTAGLKEGDLYFTDNALYTWTGSTWEKTVSDTTGAEIHAKVEAAMQESQKSVADLKAEVESKVSEIDSNLTTTTSDIKTSLSSVRNDLLATKTNLENTKTSLSTTVADLQKQTGQLSGSLETANSKIEYNSQAIAEVKHTADSLTNRMANAEDNVSSLQQTAGKLQSDLTNAKGDISSVKQTAEEVSTTVSNIRVGGRNLVLGTQEAKTIFDGTGYTRDITFELGYYWPDLQRVDLKKHLSNLGLTYDDTLTVSGNLTISKNGTLAKSDFADDFSVAIFRTTHNWAIHAKISKGDLADGQTTYKVKETFVIGDAWKDNPGWSSPSPYCWLNMAPSGYSISVDNYKVEKGTMATDWTPAPEDTDQAISKVSQTANSLNAYIKESRGSSTLASILSMDPNNSTIAQVVNGQVVAAINTSSDGSVKIDGKTLHITADTQIENAVIKSAMIDSIDASKITTGTLDASHINVINLDANSITTGLLRGKNIELNGDTTIHGQLNLLPTEQREVDQNVWGFHNAWHWRDSNVFAGNGGLQLQSTIVSQSYSNDNTSIVGLRGGSSAAITTVAPTYLKFTVYPSWNDVKNNFSNQLARTYIDAGRIETNDVWVGNFRLKDSQIRGINDSLYVSNLHGTNFDNAGAVGFQVWSGIGLGQNTIYTPSSDLYIQIGNVGPGLGAPYSRSGKVDVHCNRVISQRANSVSSRLSVKTDITPVTYDRALAAVEGTEMYDYRYVNDDSGQHYVSGIIDDVNPEDPQYHMDDMLINKERTARIDANLVGYHHVILQELLKKIDELQAELTELKSEDN